MFTPCGKSPIVNSICRSKDGMSRATYTCSEGERRCEAPSISKPSGRNVWHLELLCCAGELMA